MRCSRCDRPMLALFTSYVCDWCDGPPRGTFHKGWVAWDPTAPPPTTTLVFPDPASARRWMSDRSPALEVRQVLSEAPFRWVPSRGTMRGIELADRAYQVFPDHRFPAQPGAVFLAPAPTP